MVSEMTVQSVNVPRRVANLIDRREPFVHATVVRAQEPTSAHVGDQAIVHPDGTIEGFVGGQCASGSVRAAALDVLETGEGVLLRVLPEDSDDFPDAPGASVVVNPCLSGGALEIFLEPVIPAPICHVVGASPIALAVAELGEPLGFTITRSDEGDSPAQAVASIISSHGGDEQRAIREALDAGVPFIGLVASTKRGTALVDEMDLTKSELARVHTPVGLTIGAVTPHEIAVAILAQIIQAIRTEGISAASAHGASTELPRADQAIDPVCGMTVVIGSDTPHAVVDGQDYWFCCPACRDRYVTEH